MRGLGLAGCRGITIRGPLAMWDRRIDSLGGMESRFWAEEHRSAKEKKRVSGGYWGRGGYVVRIGEVVMRCSGVGDMVFWGGYSLGSSFHSFGVKGQHLLVQH